MTPLKKGALVSQVMPAPITGEVIDVRYDADKSAFEYLVRYENEEGEEAQRWFSAGEVAEKDGADE